MWRSAEYIINIVPPARLSARTLRCGQKPGRFIRSTYGGGMARASLTRELWFFLRERKKFWLLPILVVLVAVGSLLVFAQGSALAPFIYTIF